MHRRSGCSLDYKLVESERCITLSIHNVFKCIPEFLVYASIIGPSNPAVKSPESRK